MRSRSGDSTPYSTVRICSCGARFLAGHPDDAYRLLATHQTRAGCHDTANDAMSTRRRRASA